MTILDNPGYNRAKQIKFNINYDYKTLYITQSGEKGEEIVGTLENPFTVAGVNKYVKTLGSDVQSPNEVYIKGKISQIADAGTLDFPDRRRRHLHGRRHLRQCHILHLRRRYPEQRVLLLSHPVPRQQEVPVRPD